MALGADVEPSGNTVTVTYERVAHNVTYVCRDSRGIVIDRVPVAVKVGETHAVKAPELPSPVNSWKR